MIGSVLLAATWMACGAGAENNGGNTTGGNEGGGNTTTGTSANGGDGAGTNTGFGGGFTGTGGGTSTGTGTEGCNPENFLLEQAPTPEVYLVIDRSGSMNEDGANPGVSRWTELKGAVDTALTQFEGQINFGLLMYPTGDECATSGPQVAFAEKNRTGIMKALDATTPSGGTPTAAALNNAAASLKDLGSKDAPKFLILATDGGPNCNYFLSAMPDCTCTEAQPQWCCTNNPGKCYFGSSCLDDKGTVDTVKALKDSEKIDTFVIGLSGTGQYEGLLNKLAVEGGHPQQGGQTDYYAVTDQQSLLNALKTIAVSVISCEIKLSSPPIYPDKVKIYVDGKEVPRDKTKQNGWDYTDGTNTTIELFGAACDGIQNGEEHKITATFNCDLT